MKIQITENDQQLIVDALVNFAKVLEQDCENVARESNGNVGFDRIRQALAERKRHAVDLADAIADVEEE